MSAPIGGRVKPGAKSKGFGQRRILIAGGLAVLLVFYIRSRSSSSPAVPVAESTSDPFAGGLSGDGYTLLSDQVANFAAVLEDQQSALSDLTTWQVQTEALAYDAATQAFLATQAANDALMYGAGPVSGGDVAGGGSGAGDPTPIRRNPAPSFVPAPLVDWAAEVGITSGYSPGLAADQIASLFSGQPAELSPVPYATVQPPLPGPSSPAPPPPPAPIAYWDPTPAPAWGPPAVPYYDSPSAGPDPDYGSPTYAYDYGVAGQSVAAGGSGHRELEI